MPRKNDHIEVLLALSPVQAAKSLNVPLRVVREALESGELFAHVIGNRKRIPVPVIMKWLESHPLSTRKVPSHG